MSGMTIDQMATALKALGRFGVYIREPGNWYASAGAEIKRGGMLESPTVREPTPEAAVAALFAIYSASGAVVIIDAFRPERRTVRWNGFMWEDVV